MTTTLTTLPGELRNQLYKYLLLLPKPSTRRSLGDPPLHTSILLTCRLLHREGILILYGSNTFLAHHSLLTDLPRLRIYYSTIQLSSLISLITKYHIRVRLDCDPNFNREKATRAFTGMEELTVEVFQAAFNSSDQRALRLFEGVRGVKNVRIYGSIIQFPEYVAWLEETMRSPVGTVRVFEPDRDLEDVLEVEE